MKAINITENGQIEYLPTITYRIGKKSIWGNCIRRKVYYTRHDVIKALRWLKIENTAEVIWFIYVYNGDEKVTEVRIVNYQPHKN